MQRGEGRKPKGKKSAEVSNGASRAGVGMPLYVCMCVCCQETEAPCGKIKKRYESKVSVCCAYVPVILLLLLLRSDVLAAHLQR